MIFAFSFPFRSPVSDSATFSMLAFQELHGTADHRFEQGFFGSEMIKETAFTDLGLVGGRLERQMGRTALGHDFFGRLEDQFPGISFASDR